MASAAEGDVGAAAGLTRVLQWAFQELSLNYLATSLGASEQALRLIISIFLGKDPRASFRPVAESAGDGDGASPPASRGQPGGLWWGACVNALTHTHTHASRLFMERQDLVWSLGLLCPLNLFTFPSLRPQAVPFTGRHRPPGVPTTSPYLSLVSSLLCGHVHCCLLFRLYQPSQARSLSAA